VNAKVVASGIQVALVTTAGGLIVAVPVLAAFYLFAHVLQNHQQRAAVKISELTSKLPGMMNDESGN
jgi:biopolymer transport protein ExbB/TolQ